MIIFFDRSLLGLLDDFQQFLDLQASFGLDRLLADF